MLHQALREGPAASAVGRTPRGRRRPRGRSAASGGARPRRVNPKDGTGMKQAQQVRGGQAPRGCETLRARLTGGVEAAGSMRVRALGKRRRGTNLGRGVWRDRGATRGPSCTRGASVKLCRGVKPVRGWARHLTVTDPGNCGPSPRVESSYPAGRNGQRHRGSALTRQARGRSGLNTLRGDEPHERRRAVATPRGQLTQRPSKRTPARA